jgi:IS5 family transposase
MTQLGFFTEENRLARLAELGDKLIPLDKTIDWKIFLPIIEKVFSKPDRRSNAGNKPFDRIQMWKTSILRRYYGLSFDQIEYQISDRLSFQRFLGITMADKVPDSRTVWYFENKLAEAGVIEELFSIFAEKLTELGIMAKEGSIIDASFIEQPRQHNSREENERIKKGEIPEEWNGNKCAQKDVDAKWTKKGDRTYFGRKNHVKVCRKTKLIKKWKTTAANAHDSQVYGELLEENEEVWVDSAYQGQEAPEGVIQHVCERAYSKRPLTDKQKADNREKSKIRCRCEHVFGFIENSMHGSYCRSIGNERTNFWNGLTNLIYNMFRFMTLKFAQTRCV